MTSGSWKRAGKHLVYTCDDLQAQALKKKAAGALGVDPHAGKDKYKVKGAGAKAANGIYFESGTFAGKPQYKSEKGFELFCNYAGRWTIGKIGMSYYCNKMCSAKPPKDNWSRETFMTPGAVSHSMAIPPCPTVKPVKKKVKSPDQRLPKPKKMWATDSNVALMNMPNTIGRKMRDLAKDQFVKVTHQMGNYYKLKHPEVGYVPKAKLTEDAPNDDERNRSISSEPPSGSEADSSDEEAAAKAKTKESKHSPSPRRKRSRSRRRSRSRGRKKRRRRSRSRSPSSAHSKPQLGKEKMLNMSLDDLSRRSRSQKRRRSRSRSGRSSKNKKKRRRSRSRRKRSRSRSRRRR